MVNQFGPIGILHSIQMAVAILTVRKQIQHGNRQSIRDPVEHERTWQQTSILDSRDVSARDPGSDGHLLLGEVLQFAQLPQPPANGELPGRFAPKLEVVADQAASRGEGGRVWRSLVGGPVGVPGGRRVPSRDWWKWVSTAPAKVRQGSELNQLTTVAAHNFAGVNFGCDSAQCGV